jgi:hypothetical protein
MDDQFFFYSSEIWLNLPTDDCHFGYKQKFPLIKTLLTLRYKLQGRIETSSFLLCLNFGLFFHMAVYSQKDIFKIKRGENQVLFQIFNSQNLTKI